MKKLLLSILFLASSYNTIKPMEYTAVLGAMVAATPTAICAIKHVYHGSGDATERIKKSCAWIARGAVLGAFAGLTVAPMMVCGDVLPVQCTESSLQLSTLMVSVLAALDNGVRYTQDIKIS